MLWPNGAKMAFSLGFDLDGDTIWKNKTKGLPNGERYLKGPSIGLYGPQKGALHILEILDEFDLKATWFIPGDIVCRHPGIVEKILNRGHEIAHHGMDHTGEYGPTTEAQLEHIDRCQEVFLKYAGVRAVGIRKTGALLPETELRLYNSGDYLYCSDSTRCEALGWYQVAGQVTRAVNIPCLSEQMDDYVQTVYNTYPAVLVGMPRIAAYDTVFNSWLHEIEGCIRFGGGGASAFHPQISGAPGRAMILRKFCRYLAENPLIWCAPCREVAQYYSSETGGVRNVC